MYTGSPYRFYNLKVAQDYHTGRARVDYQTGARTVETYRFRSRKYAAPSLHFRPGRNRNAAIADTVSELVNNHSTFEDFGWYNRPDDDENFTIYNVSHRDSQPMALSNAAVIEREVIAA